MPNLENPKRRNEVMGLTRGDDSMGALMPSHDLTPRPNTGGVSQEFHHHSVSNVVISVTVLGLTWVVKLWEKHNCESLRFANTINNLKFQDKFGARWFGTCGRMMFLLLEMSNGDYIIACWGYILLHHRPGGNPCKLAPSGKLPWIGLAHSAQKRNQPKLETSQ